MIPLMAQQDYSAKGWLGLILGTRLWYPMWDAEKDDDAAFEKRLDNVVREIGDRGRLMVAYHEAAAPLEPFEPTPAPAPAPAPTPITIGGGGGSSTTRSNKPILRPEVTAPVRTSAAAAAPAPIRAPAAISSSAVRAARGHTLDTPSAAATALVASERDELRLQVQEMSAQLASLGVSGSLSSTSQRQLASSGGSSVSEAFLLAEQRHAERERADREREAERERAEREREREAQRERAERERAERSHSEARLIAAALGVGMCSCGIGAAIVGAAVLLKRSDA